MTSRHDSTNEPRRISARRTRRALAVALAAVCCVFVLAVLVGPAASRVASVEGVGPAVEVADGAANAGGTARGGTAGEGGSAAAKGAASADDAASAARDSGAANEPADANANEPDDEPRWEPDVVLVSLADDVEVEAATAALEQARCLESVTVTADDIDLGFVKVPLAEGYDVKRALAELEGIPAIKGAQPNFIYHLADDGLGDEGASTAGTAQDTTALPSFLEQQNAIVAGTIATQSTPNDPYLSNQWALNSINAYDAWDVVKAGDAGDESVTVAIVDNGCRMDHEDLTSNIADTYNAVTGTSDVSPETSVSDYNHGTHVAGIVSAAANNGLGVAGVSYNARLLPIKVFKGKDATTAYIAKAYRYIRQHADALNIKVVNMSVGVTMGGPSDFTEADLEEDDELTSAVTDAYKAGILTVCSAGNDAGSGQGKQNGPYYNYPSDWLDCAISVIALRNGTPPTRADYSNYNIAGLKTKDLSAPGSTIYSTFASSTSAYANDSGTSMASPCVAGVAALVYAVNPDFTPAEVTGILCSTAKTLGDDTDNDGWTDEYGHGEVDALAAVNAAQKGFYITGKNELLVGGKVQLAVSQEGSFAWASSNSSVATIDSSGLVTGVAGGTATITATHGDVRVQRDVTVYDISFTGSTSVPFGKMTSLTFNENPDTGLWYIDTENVATENGDASDGGAGESGGGDAGSGGSSGTDGDSGAGSDTATTGAFFANDRFAVATVGNSIDVYGNRAGSAQVSATLATNNDLVVRYPIRVTSRPIADAAIVWPDADFTYNGATQALRPSKVTLACSYGGKAYDYTLVEGVDYAVSFENAAGETVAAPTAAGTYKARLTGIGNFSGSTTRTYTIARKQVTVTAVSTGKDNVYDPNPEKYEARVEGALDADEGRIEYAIACNPGDEAGVPYPITVTGDALQCDGNYEVSFVNGIFVIGSLSLADPEVSVSCNEWLYDGVEREPEIALAYGSETIPANLYKTTVYSSGNVISGGRIVDAGSYAIEVAPLNTAQLADVAKCTLEVSPRTIALTSSSASKVYDGSALTEPAVSIEGDGFVDGEVSNVRATGSVARVGVVKNSIAFDKSDAFKASNYRIAESVGTLEVLPAPIAQASVSAVAARAFTGKAYKPAPAVKLGSATLVAGRDYTLSYATAAGTAVASPIAAGSYKLTITGKGNYTGTVSRAFAIAPASIARASVPAVAARAFTGKAYKPAPAVKLGSATLVAGRDYTLSYATAAGKAAKPVKAGSYRLVITAKGNYTGTVKRSFSITRAKQALKLTTAKKTLKAKKLAKKAQKAKGAIRVKGAKTTLSYKITKVSKKKFAKKFAVNKKGIITVKKGTPRGTYKLTVCVRAKATANYVAATKTKVVTIKVR